MHGGPGQSSNVMRWLLQLATTVPVILYDQSGAGRSATVRATHGHDIETTMSAYVRELEGVLQLHGADRVHLVGHSFGAAIAIDFAVAHPKSVESLALLSPVIDGGWWAADADFHRAYVLDSLGGVPPRGDQKISKELLERWVMGPNPKEVVNGYMCNASGEASCAYGFGPPMVACVRTVRRKTDH